MTTRTKLCLKVLAFVAASSLAASAAASPIVYSYKASIGFNPNTTVGAGGKNAGQLIDELFGSGIGSTGNATLSGSFTYDNTTARFDGNSRSAGYANAITNATISFGSGDTAKANIPLIRQNANSSSVGFNAVGSSFCGNKAECQRVNLPFVPTGNLIQVTNDTDFQIVGPNGTAQFTPRDALEFSLGGTDADDEFSPEISTSSFGDLSVDLVSTDLISKKSPDFFDSVALPENLSFLNDTDLDSSIFNITFTGPQLDGDLVFQGSLEQVAGGTSLEEGSGQTPTNAVPEPNAFAMLAVSLIGIFGFKFRSRLRVS